MREVFNVFMTITEHEAANFRYGANYLGIAGSDDLAFIQMTANDTRGAEKGALSGNRELLGESPGIRDMGADARWPADGSAVSATA